MNKKKLIISIAIPIAIGIISSIVGNISTEFNNFTKPLFTPPAIVFPIVWTILYILLGISSYLVYKSYDLDKNKTLIIYAVNLLLNFLWCLFFFKFKMFLLSIIILILLLIDTIIMIYYFYKVNKISGYIQIPYLLWLIFALILNYFVYTLN